MRTLKPEPTSVTPQEPRWQSQKKSDLSTLGLLNATSFTLGKVLWHIKSCKPHWCRASPKWPLSPNLWLKGSNSSGKLQHTLPVKHVNNQKSSNWVLPVHQQSSSNSSIISNNTVLPDDPTFLVVSKLYRKVGDFTIFAWMMAMPRDGDQRSGRSCHGNRSCFKA